MPKCILIVDDFEPMRKAVRAFFESQSGFDVCGEAVDGYDAIEKARELKPELIILDLSMPRMSGISAAPILKKMLPQTPIVLLTSHQHGLQCYDTRRWHRRGHLKGRRHIVAPRQRSRSFARN